MVVPESFRESFSPREIQFLSSNELIPILPRFAMKSTALVGRTMPQLRVLSRTEVPLWIAIILKEQGKCNFVSPSWLCCEQLKDRYEEELQNRNRFSQLPWNWQEIAQAFLSYAPDDLPDPASQLFYILQDLKEIRKSKAQRGLHELNESNVQLNGLSLMEINEMKPFVVNVMNELRCLHEAIGTEEPGNESDEDVNARD